MSPWSHKLKAASAAAAAGPSVHLPLPKIILPIDAASMLAQIMLCIITRKLSGVTPDVIGTLPAFLATWSIFTNSFHV